MKYTILLLLLVIFVPFINRAQTTISFHYNDSGSRDIRTVLNLKKATISNSGNEAQKDEIVEDLIGIQETRIYPNPTKGLLRVDFPTLTEQKAVIRIYDQRGKLIFQKSASGNGARVDLSNYPQGFYIMRITIGQDQKEWKIVKD